MTTAVIETESGALLLPPTPPHTVPAPARIAPWAAHLACDADWRKKHRVYVDVAARITITKGQEQ